jgi:hypothetical protein
MASITSGEMADCDWLRSSGGPLRKNKCMHFKTKQENKLKIIIEFVINKISANGFKWNMEGIIHQHWYFFSLIKFVPHY